MSLSRWWLILLRRWTDSREQVAGFHAPVVGSPWQAVDSRGRADGPAADSHEPEADSPERVDESGVELSRRRLIFARGWLRWPIRRWFIRSRRRLILSRGG